MAAFCRDGGLKAAHDPDFLRVGVPGVQVGHVPALIGRVLETEGALGRGAEETAGVLKHVAAFVFEHHQGVFTVLPQQLEEAGLGVEAVTEQDVEATGVGLEDPLQ